MDRPFGSPRAAGGAWGSYRRRPAGRRAARRSWQRRSRRAQASAIATLLGLLLVVTFIANYLSTTLPNQMQANDEAHQILVTNELGRFQTLLFDVAAAGTVGTFVAQPLVLGSDPEPPFAGPDSSTLTSLSTLYPAAPGPGISVNYSLQGGLNFLPPTGGKANSGTYTAAACSTTGTPVATITCSSSSKVYWNFTVANSGTYAVTTSSTTVGALNFTTNSSTISVTLSGAAATSNYVTIIGNSNTISIHSSSAATWHIVIVGNSNTVAITSSGGAAIKFEVVGNQDTVTDTASGGGSILLAGYGTNETYTGTGSGGTGMAVYYTGFNASNATSSQCPYDNGAGTDTATGTSSGGTLTASYNNSTGAGGSVTHNGWTYTTHVGTTSTCPFFARSSVAASTTTSAGLVVRLHNTYLPTQDLAFDEGAVVVAQPAAVPVMLDGPSINYSTANGTFSLVVPYFTDTLPTDSGTATSILAARLQYSSTLVLPGSGGSSLVPGSSIVIRIGTPFAAAWTNYFAGIPAFQGLYACSGPSSACSGPYTPGGPIGYVTLTIPAPTFVVIQLAGFSVSLV